MNLEDEYLSGAAQENVLTLLCFDPERAKLIRSAVTPKTFESAVYRDIASQAITFFDQFGAPIGEHLSDALEHVLEGDDKRKATSYKRTLENLFLTKEQINGDYVLSQLNKFVRQQRLKSSIITAVEAIEAGKVDEAEVAMQEGLSSQIVSFEGGTNLKDTKNALRFLDHKDDEKFLLNIKELDDSDCCARRKELLVFIAPRGRGKSWFSTHVAKMSMIQRATVVIFTLEMSEERYTQRLVQSLFGISKRDPRVRVSTLKKDEHGLLTSIDTEELERQTLADPNIKLVLRRKLDQEMKRRPPLLVKEFPTGMLTINMMRAYLDGLERFQKITPDLIIVDYPDLMEIDTNNLRVETGKIYAALRGIGVERNCAVVALSQGNRSSETASLVVGSMAAEDISKLAIADTVITYSQTPAEKAMGLARLLVDKNRSDVDKYQVLISQSYQMGQFCLGSARMSSDYWETIDQDRKADD